MPKLAYINKKSLRWFEMNKLLFGVFFALALFGSTYAANCVNVSLEINPASLAVGGWSYALATTSPNQTVYFSGDNGITFAPSNTSVANKSGLAGAALTSQVPGQHTIYASVSVSDECGWLVQDYAYVTFYTSCTPGWICVNSSMRAYRRSDCSLSNYTYCAGGCSNRQCNACTEAWICSDPYHKAYQTRGCSLMNITTCTCGCSNGACNQQCTAGWFCMNSMTKAYKDSCCSVTQQTNCTYGCLNGACKAKTVPEPPKPGTRSKMAAAQTENLPAATLLLVAAVAVVSYGFLIREY